MKERKKGVKGLGEWVWGGGGGGEGGNEDKSPKDISGPIPSSFPSATVEKGVQTGT